MRFKSSLRLVLGVLILSIGSTATGTAAISPIKINPKMAFGGISDATKGERITIATYNVENFFDVRHDEGKRDWEFLPKGYPGKEEGCGSAGSFQNRCTETDWTFDRFQLKLQQVRKVFSYTNVRPDILALQEVENAYVVRNLAQTLGYSNYIIEEGPDRRGIDVALLYRAEKIEYIEHHSERVSGAGNTRDILGAYFRRKGSSSDAILGVYVNHWPSQSAPSSFRITTARALKKFIESDKRKFGASNLHVVALGDFNTVDGDNPHPFDEVIETRDSGAALIDTRALADSRQRRNQPPGTSFYPRKMKWDFLDRIFISANLRDGSGTDAIDGSYFILWDERITEDYYDSNDASVFSGSVVRGIPKRYNFNASTAAEAGFSDHLSVKLDIYLR